MAKSREQFMAELGITEADVIEPPAGPPVSKRSSTRNAPPVPPPRAPRVQQSTPKFHDESFVRVDAVPSPPQRTSRTHFAEAPEVPTRREAKAAPPSTTSNSAREEFLRSMGIDNMDAPSTFPEEAEESTQKATSFRASRDIDCNPSPNEQQEPSVNCYGAFQKDHFLGRKSKNANQSQPTASSPRTQESVSGDVNDLKAHGNKAFEQGDFRKAVRLYTQAIDLDSSNAALYSNRSASYLQGGKQMGIDTRAMALRDADKAIELREDWFKAWSRRGDALFKLERYEEAIVAYQRSYECDTSNTNALHSVSECRMAIEAITGGRKVTAEWASSSTAPMQRTTSKTLNELIHELKRQTENDSNIRLGNDYRQQELEKLRLQRSGKSQPESPNKPVRADVPPEFSTDAAKCYRDSLLKSFRTKKSA